MNEARLDQAVLDEAVKHVRRQRTARWFATVAFVLGALSLLTVGVSHVLAPAEREVSWVTLVLAPVNLVTLVTSWRNLRRGPYRHMVLLRREFGYDESAERAFAQANFPRWFVLTTDLEMSGHAYRVYTFPRAKEAALFKLFFG